MTSIHEHSNQPGTATNWEAARKAREAMPDMTEIDVLAPLNLIAAQEVALKLREIILEARGLPITADLPVQTRMREDLLFTTEQIGAMANVINDEFGAVGVSIATDRVLRQNTYGQLFMLVWREVDEHHKI